MTAAGADEAAIARWGRVPRDVLDAMEPDGDFAKRHLLNGPLLRLLGDVHGRRVLDAGCGHGYLSRMLAERGAAVVGLEPAASLYEYAVGREEERRQGIRYLRAPLGVLPELGLDPFDAAACSMVLCAIPDWRPALAALIGAVRPGGRLVIALPHPCFGPSPMASWREHGCVQVREYAREHEIPGRWASDHHRTLSTYINALIAHGCRIAELAEPTLDPGLVAGAEPGVEAYVHVPNFLVLAADA